MARLGLIARVGNLGSGSFVYKTTEDGKALLEVLKKVERFVSVKEAKSYF